MKVCLPPWASLEIIGGLKVILPEPNDQQEDLHGGVEGVSGEGQQSEQSNKTTDDNDKGGNNMGEKEGKDKEGSGQNLSKDESSPRQSPAKEEGMGPSEDKGDHSVSGREAGGAQLLPDTVPATSLKFRPGDPTSYLVGTVAGHLLVCRTFERRGSVAVFGGHRGLVTALDWRPGQQGDPATVFLSAALDDTVRVWHLDKRTPHAILKNPQASSGPGGYVDACWCPWYTNLVASVHGGGLHLWDISVSTHTPALTHPVQAATCVAFSPHTRNVVVGDRSGSVRVIHLEGLIVSSSTAFHRFSSVLSRISMLGLKDENQQEE